MNGLNHNALTCSAVPIPPWERPLQTVEAQPYFNVSQASLVLEGIVFDRNNNLLFVDVATGRVFKLTIFKSSDRCGETVARTCLFGQRRISQFSYCNMSAHNVYYVKCNVVLNNVIFDSCLFPHQHYDRHSFHARECCAIRQNVRGDKSSMAFNNHFAHYSLFSYSKSQGNSFSHTCCLYCPAYLTAVAFSDRTRHGMPDEMLI